MSKSVLVPVADGSEEMEAVIIVDVLRRAGADVTVASVGDRQITASRGVKIVADCLIGECRDRMFDLIVLPGGMPGAEHLRDNDVLKQMLIRQQDENRLFAAICASPAVVLAHHGLLRDRRATAYPTFVDRLRDTGSAELPVVVDGNCVTSRGPGTALAFSLELVALLFGDDVRNAVAEPMVISGA